MTGSPLVIDASIALRWLLPDRLSDASWRLFEGTVQRGDQITAPTLWVYEVVSGLTKAIFFQNLSRDDARKSLARFFTLNAHLIDADEKLSSHALDWTIRLQRLASYDSYYLALAESLGCELWTADRKFFNSVKDVRIEWIHWIEEA